MGRVDLGSPAWIPHPLPAPSPRWIPVSPTTTSSEHHTRWVAPAFLDSAPYATRLQHVWPHTPGGEVLPRNCHIPEELLHSRGTTVPGPSRAPESWGKPRHSEPAENPHGDWGETRRIQLEKSWKTSAVVAVGTHCLYLPYHDV